MKEHIKDIRDQLRHVYWIGGGSGAGKSTVSRHIADKHGLQVYATDDVMPDHAKRSTPESCPLLHAFISMDMDERWLSRAPQEMLETFHWFQGEGFDMIVEDLLSLPADKPVIAEGFRLLPHLVAPLLARPENAVWLLPVTEFRKAVFADRWGEDGGFVAKTSDRAQALCNLLARDAMFTDRLQEETARIGMTAIEVNGALTVEGLAGRIEKQFEL
ncbi:MAG: hypothetical protein OXT65_04725 [Alphaproteobacteria bacterium]|nr:hypothetical protein [Alphaproteobacteria bacterium]